MRPDDYLNAQSHISFSNLFVSATVNVAMSMDKLEGEQLDKNIQRVSKEESHN